MKNNSRNSFWQTALRGFAGRCPACGAGKIFQSYLKPVEKCGKCGEALGHIRADDAPAWLTMVIVGHLLAPFLIWVPLFGRYPDYMIISVFLVATLALTLPLLPRCKGLFIALIWRFRCEGSEKT